MRQAALATLASLALAATAHAAEAGTESNAAVGWVAVLFIAAGAALILLVLVRGRKAYSAMDRSIVISEEILLLYRQQVALQTETNRLLGRLVEERGANDPA